MRGILQMGLRPKPPASACGDPFAPRRCAASAEARRARLGPWGKWGTMSYANGWTLAACDDRRAGVHWACLDCAGAACRCVQEG